MKGHYSEAMNLIGKKRESNCAGTVLYFSGLSDVLEYVDCDVAHSILTDKCEIISQNDLKTGDILSNISHYAIYIGNGLCFEQKGNNKEFCVKKVKDDEIKSAIWDDIFRKREDNPI